jgi:glycosyltransferase involved in cell wall biosynthesis
MSRILLFTPDLHYSGSSKEVFLFSRQLLAAGATPEVVALRELGPVADSLRSLRIPVHCLDWRHAIPLSSRARLRQIVNRHSPDQIHLWKTSCLRAWFTSFPTKSTPLVMWKPDLPSINGYSLWSWLDWWMLKQADRIIFSNPWQKEQGCQLGLEAKKLGVAPFQGHGDPVPAATTQTPLTAGDPSFILCVGPLLPGRGHLEALWAFDVIRQVFPDLQLWLLGDGPERPRLLDFSQRMQSLQHVRFLGVQNHLAPFYAAARVVWVPTQKQGGRHVIAEAMSAGKPVIATNLPELADLIDNGRTGFLISPREKVRFAQLTRNLLDNPNLCAQIGRAARDKMERMSRECGVFENLLHACQLPPSQKPLAA